jgi:hypothetical protein
MTEVTLHDIPVEAIFASARWMYARDLLDHYDLGLMSGPNFSYCSYSFDNDIDAIMFKLTFAQYL